jgi:hypothetical protein
MKIDILYPSAVITLGLIFWFGVIQGDVRLAISVLSIECCYIVSRASAEVRLIGYITMVLTNSYWLTDAIMRADMQMTCLWAGYLVTVVLGLKNSKNALEEN